MVLELKMRLAADRVLLAMLTQLILSGDIAH